MATQVDNEGITWSKVWYHLRSALAVLLSLGILIGGGWYAYDKGKAFYEQVTDTDDFEGEGEQDIEVIIPQGASLTQIGDILMKEGVVSNRDYFKEEATKNPKAAEIKFGRYKMRTKIPVATAIDMLLDPENRHVLKITVIEGLTASQQFDKIAEQIDVTKEQLDEVPVEELDLPDFAGEETEGFLFPDTYEVAEPIDAKAIQRNQVAQFNAVVEELQWSQRADTLGVTELDMLTIASIVEREANDDPEVRAKVAGVIYNRLEKGMKLRMDSTVHYASGRFDTVTTTEEERATDSPYNTYLYKGLPPGPICNPGKASMDAASNPADNNDLFFVTVNPDTGETRFAETEEEHAQNVALFQEWCEESGKC